MAMRSQKTIKLDRLDRQLLHALRINGRASFRLIAEVLGSSEQTIARRYRRLREAGVVRVHVLPVPGGPGLDWLVRIGMRPGTAQPLAAALAKRSDVSWVNITSGGAEIVCFSRPSSAEQRDRLLLERLPRTNAVTSLVAHAILRSFTDRRWSGFGDQLSDEERAILVAERREAAAAARGDRAIADDDRPLLAALAQDGRATYAHLANAAQQSANSAARRLESLIASGAVEITTDLAFEMLGFPTVATVWLSVAPSHLEEVGARVANLPAAAHAAALTGPANMVATVVCRSADELYEQVSNQIGAIEAVHEAEISPVIRRVKAAGSVLEGGRLPVPA